MGVLQAQTGRGWKKVGNSKRRITIVLEPKSGLISLPSFRIAIEQLSILLNEVSSEISEPKPSHVYWGLAELSMNSPARISVESTSEEVEGTAGRTTSVIVEGLAKLQKERTRPQYFNDNALESAQRLARLSGDNIARINIYSDLPNQQTYVNEQIAVNISSILEYLDYHGSVEGRLELISGKEGQPVYFRVQDRINKVGVRCIIADELLEKEALNAFRKRVIVSGIIKSDNNGIPRSINVDNIDILPEEKDLPQDNDLVKLLGGFTTGISTYEHES